MDNMENIEKKAKRPRIGAKPVAQSASDGGRYEKIEYNPGQYSGNRYNSYNNSENGDQAPRRSNYRSYREDGGGFQRYSNNQGGAGYRQRSQTDNGGEYYPRRQGSYQPRSNSYTPRDNNEGGYQPRHTSADGGYQRREYQGGGYQRRENRENYGTGGYDRPRYDNNGAGRYRPQNEENGGGFQRRPGGYQRGQGGYPTRQGGYQQRYGGYQRNQFGGGQMHKRPGNSFVPRPKRIEYEMPIPDVNEQTRLNKFMANAGICSRREADEFIQQGLVKVNGKVVTELGTKITHSDTVEYDDKVVALENKCYILLNKPKDCVTTSDDPNGRLTVLDLVKGACDERIYPVGRLDRNTTGVLLLTNDGDLASKLTHPKYVKKKIYHVWCDHDITEADMQQIADGVELEDGMIHADAISYANEKDRNQAGIEIHSGQNRIVRRIFEKLGYHVTKLDRVYFAGLTKKNLPRGRWRYLTQEEVNKLKRGAFE